MSASQGSKDHRAKWAANVRKSPDMTWCPEFAHGWYDAVYSRSGCPRCNPTKPAKPKKASGTVALNWQWCPAEDHGWYEGINRDGFLRDCDKCAREAMALNRQWCPAKDHGWYEGINSDGFFRDCDKCAREASAQGENKASS